MGTTLVRRSSEFEDLIYQASTGVQQDDWIAYRGRKFKVISWDEYEFEGSYLVTAKEVKGASLTQTVEVEADQSLALTGVANVEP